MQGVEISHLNAVIHAILMAYYALMDSTVAEALRSIHKYGKADTLGLDAMPEITIVEELSEHDRNAVVITEETGPKRRIELVPVAHPRAFRTIFFSDPTDRSSPMKKYLSGAQTSRKLRDIFREAGSVKTWESRFGSPASITGPASAISCVRHGVPIFAVLVNYVTQQMFVSCSAGNFAIDLPAKFTKIGFDYVLKHGKQILFPGIDDKDMRRFVTFLGKEGYKENLIASRLIEEREFSRTLHYDLPGGPLRALYLSELQANAPGRNVGFILANGEKIGEWMHWLPFVRFARDGRDLGKPALRLFEIYQDELHTKDGVLMATPPIYSIFTPFSESDPRMIVNVNALANFPNPSKVRATLIVAPFNNSWATRAVNQYGYRPIEFYSED